MSGPSLSNLLVVQELLARYCWYVDEGRGAEWAALYTDDGVFEGTRPEPVCGRAALAEVPVQLQEQFGGRLRHQFSNLYLEPSEDQNALIAKYYNQIGTWDGGPKLLMLAVTTASLIREGADSPWLIERVTVVPLA